jgi:3-oxo-5-alpha-steroid 4-dehydrogenase
MEVVSPLTFIFTYLRSPLSFGSPRPISLSDPTSVLASLFLVHYLNRSLISPLRTPSRSKSHISVPISAIIFNLINGSLIGAYLSSPAAAEFLSGCYEKPTFWLGVFMWAIGFVGNIVHDEILLNIRRKADAKGKARDSVDKKTQQEYYAIPNGLLYKFVSFPNYFCEWMEWRVFLYFFVIFCYPHNDSSTGLVLQWRRHHSQMFLPSRLFWPASLPLIYSFFQRYSSWLRGRSMDIGGIIADFLIIPRRGKRLFLSFSSPTRMYIYMYLIYA